MGDLNDVHPSLTILRVLVTVFHLLAILTTVWRLLYRVKKHSWWWEDAWATIALAGDIASLISVWIVTAPPGPGVSDELRIVASWTVIVSFTICLWSARLSIVFSILRLTPPARRIRKITITTAWVFVVISIALLVQKTYVCARDEVECALGSLVGATQLATDFASDIAIVILPIQLLREVNVPKDQRILILSVFSSSILISLVSVAHVIFIIQTDAYLQTITGQVELALSVLVCDLLVLVTFFYRVRHARDLNVDRRRQPSSTHTVLFTTVFGMDDITNTGLEDSPNRDICLDAKVDARDPSEEAT